MFHCIRYWQLVCSFHLIIPTSWLVAYLYFAVQGNHPDDNQPVLLAHSKFGFSIKHRRTVSPVPKVCALLLVIMFLLHGWFWTWFLLFIYTHKPLQLWVRFFFAFLYFTYWRTSLFLDITICWWHLHVVFLTLEYTANFDHRMSTQKRSHSKPDWSFCQVKMPDSLVAPKAGAKPNKMKPCGS